MDWFASTAAARWQRLQGNLTSCDLSKDLTDYEERRAGDQKKLQTMIDFCQTTDCRTKFILEHFGEEVSPEWSCNNCDACDAREAWNASESIARDSIGEVRDPSSSRRATQSS